VNLLIFTFFTCNASHFFMSKSYADHDPQAASRKKDHIELAFQSQVTENQLDTRFYYEPLLAAHPKAQAETTAFPFLGKTQRLPMWVSSMTGGTVEARTINRNLAKACGEFGFGMGLGSCRALLTSNDTLEDFDVRAYMGEEVPLFANLGVAQVEALFRAKEEEKILELVHKLRADGLILHVNPLQEWLQPEGDRFTATPLEVAQEVLSRFPSLPLIVKEVGQGMGPASLRALLELPLAAIDFGAAGWTNFALLELLRAQPELQKEYAPLAQVGHSATEMLRWVSESCEALGVQRQCKQLIISGGIKNFLQGYALVESAPLPAVYGQASAFLAHARGEYEALRAFVQRQAEGLAVAKAYLAVR
jgi:isopentenyl-diphosphate delta-isomerase